MYRSSAVKRQRTARRQLVRAYRGASSTRVAMRRNRIMAVSRSTRGRGELKTVDGVAGTSTNVIVPLNTTNSNVFPVNLITIGASENNRIGRRIEMASLHLKGVITQTANTTTIQDYARLAVVYDRQPNAALTTSNIIFQDIAPDGASGSRPCSGVNPDQRERFLVLADIKLTLPASVHASGTTGATDGSIQTFNINRFIKLNGLTTHYQSDTSPAIIGDVSSGALLVVGMGNLSSGSEGWQFVGTWRLRYADT